MHYFPHKDFVILLNQRKKRCFVRFLLSLFFVSETKTPFNTDEHFNPAINYQIFCLLKAENT